MDSTPWKTNAPAHRLLYRGSLSLPDSHLLLDGLSFTLKTAHTHGSPALLDNTLALTFESLRGRNLHLIGTVRVKDLWIEPPPADISVDVHPDATLTRIYLENLFCLNPITSPDGKADYGIRVSLTDNSECYQSLVLSVDPRAWLRRYGDVPACAVPRVRHGSPTRAGFALRRVFGKRLQYGHLLVARDAVKTSLWTLRLMTSR
ncbi:hypothetical protein BD310DRAFT_478524 [Dichomitus squalens]|uniref:Uncharacterized protein n=1 Tax=Dichomitus squalens TaxID=114155 RepID=A0A4Q9PVR3_9APHY|nr:hypothetical protein BD310DRAFT_478524 [Dichomitus squalens]